jgi:hypothetical protein
LKSKSENKKFRFVSNPNEADVIIFFDFKKDSKSKQFISKYSGKFFVLIRTEPPSVLESQYVRELPFQLVIDLGKWNSFNNKAVYMEWPVCDEFFQNQSKNSVSLEKRILFLNTNKFGNLNTYYYLRRKIAYQSEGYLRIFGKGWSIFDFQIRSFIGNFLYNLLRFRLTELRLMNFFFKEMLCMPKTSYLTKFELFEKFDYVLVIENDASYMSEKLIEALLLGKIVLYIGSDISQIPFPLSESIIIPKPSYNDVKKTIENVFLGKHIASILEENPSILLANWNSTKVWNKILEIITRSYFSN